MDTSITKAEWSGFAFVIAIAALSIVAALVRWITLKLVQNAPKANITHTIDVVSNFRSHFYSSSFLVT